MSCPEPFRQEAENCLRLAVKAINQTDKDARFFGWSRNG